ncbi:MAG: hypothetical protein C0607_11910 [Azoarcus sp.]|uniref:Uncharacterized protein n=1 Tax=Parazoarcus communis TaxID=41977 RepID=A0A2U8GK70_9RHOO|nr:hypothetical protein [Parazoarcus communis]AWI73902.1 hypothetical protein CEW83_00595 [Parazoarcus communis]PLX74149.1 MAG: hypothetical protein C0607_11910 [Azoarcus sp.]TVT54380.1 MAG: hypothetical protein FHK80_17250 [Azoarcus sp. PHD]|tara:strand:+ start:60029 stop:60220 length:192 start_codon:yes stop_codon:yes gene_type:complete
MSPSLRKLLLGALVLTSSACVTINIYFPAAAAEKAADRIIDEVWQLREGAAEPAQPPAEEKKP